MFTVPLIFGQLQSIDWLQKLHPKLYREDRSLTYFTGACEWTR